MKNRFVKRKTVNNLEKIRKIKSDLADMEREAIRIFYFETDSETIEAVCRIVRENGHPGEITNIEEIYGHYKTNNICAEEILNLIDLYDSNLETIRQRHESKESL